MCMLTYFPPNTLPDVDRLINGAVVNNDGHGWAIVLTGDRIITGHDMDADKAITEFARMRALYPEGAALFHSRWATHGTVNVSNCHPFLVNHDPRTVLGHNGVLCAQAQPKHGDWRSDTAILADDIMFKSFPALDSKRTRRRFESWLGTNKIVILTVDPKYKAQAYIFNESRGIWDEGVWYSNDAYLPWKPYVPATYHYPSSYMTRSTMTRSSLYIAEGCDWCGEREGDCCCTPEDFGSRTTSGSYWPKTSMSHDDQAYREYWEDLAAERTCPTCQTMGHVNADTDICEVCLTCFDCLMLRAQCQCYQPGTQSAIAAHEAMVKEYLAESRRAASRLAIESAPTGWTSEPASDFASVEQIIDGFNREVMNGINHSIEEDTKITTLGPPTV